MVHLNLSCRAGSSVATCDAATIAGPRKKKGSHFSCLAESSVATGGSRTVDKEKREKEDREGKVVVVVVQRFNYAELERATQGFSSRTLLGRGSHGTVYRAVLRDGRLVVAVKRPAASLSSLLDNEIAVLSSLRSPLLVNLLGLSYSDSGREKGRLLVVEYMPNGTLGDALHSRADPPGWARRADLALHTARALDSLHRADPPVIHRDVKSSNVLIDSRGRARLSDFGLAVRDRDDARIRATPPAGTLGYLDPAYLTPESLTTKTDVFSFGILLLEIISGRHAIDIEHTPPSIVEWAVPLIRKGKHAAICDPRIGPPMNSLALRQLAIVAARCVRPCCERRPEMSEVVQVLEEVGRWLTSERMTRFPTLIGSDLLVTLNPCSMVEVAGVVHRREDEEIKNPVTPGKRRAPVKSTVRSDLVSGVQSVKVNSQRTTLVTMMVSDQKFQSELSRRPRRMRKDGGSGA